jgi:SAM-dependent methyltransferase
MSTQPYDRVFAALYEKRWIGFAQGVSPLIRAYYESLPVSAQHRSLLDLACGTGQLMQHFAEHGYRSVGIDISPHMLHRARQNLAAHVESGQVTLIEGDVASFSLDEQFGLAVSTFDALNHLPDDDALLGCFRSTHAALVEDGVFIFDLNTRKGLIDGWNGTIIEDTEEMTVLIWSIYDSAGDRAYSRTVGFILGDEGMYERFSGTFSNTAFDMDRVCEMLAGAGFREVHAARHTDFAEPVEDPEAMGRVFFVARK